MRLLWWWNLRQRRGGASRPIELERQSQHSLGPGSCFLELDLCHFSLVQVRHNRSLRALSVFMVRPSNNPGEDALEDYKDYFPGHNAIPMRKVVNAQMNSIKEQ